MTDAGADPEGDAAEAVVSAADLKDRTPERELQSE